MGRNQMMLMVCLAVAWFARPASAQEPARTSDLNAAAIELAGGYRYLDTKEENAFSNSQGWFVDAVWNMTRLVGLVGEVGGGYDSRHRQISNEGFVVRGTADIRTLDAMGGIRLRARQSARETWFGQVLAGAVRLTSDLTVTGSGPGPGEPIVADFGETRVLAGIQFGGGLIFGLTDRLGVRVDAGMIRVFHPDEEARTLPLADGNGTNIYRFAVGMVLKIGGR